MRRCLTGEAGGIVVGWLVKLVAVFAVVGVLAFDGLSVGVAELSVTDTAAAASRAAGTVLTGGGTAQQAYDAAYRSAVTDDGVNQVPVESFQVVPDSVTLTVRRTTPTLVLHHVPGSERLLLAQSTSTHTAG